MSVLRWPSGSFDSIPDTVLIAEIERFLVTKKNEITLYEALNLQSSAFSMNDFNKLFMTIENDIPKAFSMPFIFIIRISSDPRKSYVLSKCTCFACPVTFVTHCINTFRNCFLSQCRRACRRRDKMHNVRARGRPRTHTQQTALRQNRRLLLFIIVPRTRAPVWSIITMRPVLQPCIFIDSSACSLMAAQSQPACSKYRSIMRVLCAMCMLSWRVHLPADPVCPRPRPTPADLGRGEKKTHAMYPQYAFREHRRRLRPTKQVRSYASRPYRILAQCVTAGCWVGRAARTRYMFSGELVIHQCRHRWCAPMGGGGWGVY